MCNGRAEKGKREDHTAKIKSLQASIFEEVLLEVKLYIILWIVNFTLFSFSTDS